ncbi:P-loop containing nucleoside triphosphate hydrolase protein [Macrophomina phaseolina]|uniref:P-loop containing nucleoside triphosphate hydrolase protein n=1 Tax=Macrophomina phaseolina TaxID=35725 RepID=A0ABQ8GE03_9PEZI|nr:P-loop containing nucleoside triphosphate hydrolase protein [Macrophomina phaseolina]
MVHPERTVRVLGPSLAGKKTLMGVLIYMCGLDLKMIEQLQAENIGKYDQIIDHFRRKKISPVFSAKSGPVRFTDSLQPDGVIYVVDATDPHHSALSNELDLTVSEKETLKATGSLILVVNKMDKVNWSKEEYERITKAAIQQLGTIGVPFTRIQTVPVSAIQGDNILEPSPKCSWHDASRASASGDEISGTVFDCIDRI